VYAASYSGCDGTKGGGFPFIVLYGIDQGIIFNVFMCKGLIGEFVVTICEFNELGCECGVGYLPHVDHRLLLINYTKHLIWCGSEIGVPS
jgi:hypothetical protein